MVDGVHGLRGCGAGRAAPPWRRGDRLAAARRRTFGEPLPFVVAELITVALADEHAGATDTHADGSAKRDAGSDTDRSADPGADDRAVGASAYARTDADLVAASLVGAVGRDLGIALLANEMEPLGMFLELSRRLERLTAFTALEIQHALGRCRAGAAASLPS